ncbi:MAG: PDZ domain-containing protein, partial [Fimbriimonas ginsengisoli]|nr:PDZ domain-containing protein [Fimbriimonas ginsengisoli]
MRRAKFAISTSLLLAVSFIFGFGWRDVRSGAWPSVGALSELFGRARTTSQAADAVFRNAYNRITSDYIRPVEPKTLKYAGMGGMMAALGDPHTLFLPQEAARAFAEDTQGTLVGIGAKLARDPLGTRVDKVFEGTPAYRAGLRKGDVITGVDGKPV